MNAKKCDRCNKFYEKYTGYVELGLSNMVRLMSDGEHACAPTVDFDLCPECMAKVVSFLNEHSYGKGKE